MLIGSSHGLSEAGRALPHPLRCRRACAEDQRIFQPLVSNIFEESAHAEPVWATTLRASRVAAAPQLSATAIAPAAATSEAARQPPPPPPPSACRYDHLQFFVDTLQPLEYYKSLEQRLNAFAQRVPTGSGAPADVASARDAWCELGPSAEPDAFQVHGRDLVEQMLHAFGWRITGQHAGHGTRSLLLATPDPAGARFVVTCACGDDDATAAAQGAEPVDHFSRAHLERYFASHNHAQGIGVLGFEMAGGELETVHARYEALHPNLIVAPPHTYADGTKVLDVFAYYSGRVSDVTAAEEHGTDADPGTLLRFVERPTRATEASAEGTADGGAPLPLPGLTPVAAAFEPGVLPAYADHWVSNVVSRVGFLRTLEDTLGFVPKVDFNAGVVAAGEAQIESTVTGNASPLVTTDPAEALRDRAQVHHH